MRKYPIDGKKLKQLRRDRDRGSTQKEFAYKVGLSERQLRKLENTSMAIPHDLLETLARELKVEPQQLSRDNLLLLVPQPAPPKVRREPELIPRFTEYCAEVVNDEVKICDAAAHSHVIITYFYTSLNEETGKYAERLLELLNTVIWDRPLGLELRDGLSELEWRRQVRQCVILLRGNDVWVYQAANYKRLPECNEVMPIGSGELQCQLIIAFGKPAEDGDTSVRVPVDHGRPSLFTWDW